MRCIQYATGEYLIYNDELAIAISGYRNTEHMGVHRLEDRALSEDEVLDALLDLETTSTEEPDELDEDQKRILESISVHHPAFRHKVEALGFVFLVEAKNKRQRKKEAKKRAQEDAKEIPPGQRNKPAGPADRAPPKGGEVTKQGVPLNPVQPTPAPAPTAPSGPPGFKATKVPQPSFWKEFINDYLADHKHYESLRKQLERDYGRFKDYEGSEKIIKEMEKAWEDRKGDNAADYEATVDHLMRLMEQDPTWMEFLNIEAPKSKRIKKAKTKKVLMSDTDRKSGAILFTPFSSFRKLFKPDIYKKLVNWEDPEAVANSIIMELGDKDLSEKIDVLWVEPDKVGEKREVGLSLNRGNVTPVVMQLGLTDYELMNTEGNPIVEDAEKKSAVKKPEQPEKPGKAEEPKGK